MAAGQQTGTFRKLVDAFRRGHISRRQFLEASTALGVGFGVSTFMANSVVAGPGRNGFAFYQGADGTPSASPAAGAGAIPTAGMENVTRGEGGGNAVGTEEGPALGLIREREERDAVGKAGIEHIYNLDKVDFYYTVSAPLTEETWGYDDTLARVVRDGRKMARSQIWDKAERATAGSAVSASSTRQFWAAGSPMRASAATQRRCRAASPFAMAPLRTTNPGKPKPHRAERIGGMSWGGQSGSANLRVKRSSRIGALWLAAIA